MSKVFLPQATMEEWSMGDQADVQEGRLSVAGETTTYPVTEAVHITQLVSGEDEHGLLAKVKTHAQLQALGAEQMMTSVIAGDSAYEGVPGYLVEVAPEVLLSDLASSVSARPARKGPGPETDLLAAFLLNKMT